MKQYAPQGEGRRPVSHSSASVQMHAAVCCCCLTESSVLLVPWHGMHTHSSWEHVGCCVLLTVLCRDITITPRQRIQTYREITRIRALDSPTQEQKDRYGTADPLQSLMYAMPSSCTLSGASNPARRPWRLYVLC